MKLIRAEFTNFRLLRDLILDFSTDATRRLTVIRAENESGKTTILNGLQWALYGDDALPGRSRREYRLHPIDWNVTEEGERVPITVEIDFESKSTGRRGGTRRVYRIIRSTYDSVQGEQWEPGPTAVSLFEIKQKGSTPIEPPEAWIKQELPPELREVFFTDGDRALSFIEAEVADSTKQARVRSAIESLLGLDVIQEAHDRVKRTASIANRQARDLGTDGQLNDTVDRIAFLEEEAVKLEHLVGDAERQFTEYDQRCADLDRKIEDALAKGNREALNQEILRTKRQIEQIEDQRSEAARRHSRLFRDLALSRDLVKPLIASSIAILDELRDQGKIPSNTIPVLEEYLQAPICICGEVLRGNGSQETVRRNHIQHLIEESRRSDALQSTITELYYACRSLQLDGVQPEQSWARQYARTSERRDDLDETYEELGRHLRALEVKVDKIPDVDLQGLRSTRAEFRKLRDRFGADRTRYSIDLTNVRRELSDLVRKRDGLLRQQKRGGRVMAQLEVAQDIQTVLSNTYRRLTTDELAKVSSRMNEVFLEMIGADPQQKSIIRRSEITQQFEIIVYGPNSRLLNPDRDLNGASRRALTLAFILALTKVSEVEAPNVIDTPLGMMSGYVKASVLTTASRESSQLVLFLTRSEISDCEEILDHEAAQVITLTNPAHYPVMLVNAPNVEEPTILRCDCNHRQECNICARRSGVDAKLIPFRSDVSMKNMVEV